MKPWVTELSAAERDECWRYHSLVLSRIVKCGPSYSVLMDPLRFYTGRVGELAFKHWLDAQRIAYRETVNNAGVPDVQDFIVISRSGRELSVNVKCSLHPKAQYLMQPQAQFVKHQYERYVGSRGTDYGDLVRVELWGVATLSEWQTLSQFTQRAIPTREMRLDELPSSMQEFGRQLSELPL